ncbi:MAG: uracil-DNA glycosylase, partial [Patescibacteria group bacterium]|nr:uracil-DNA glycosylase [Patescibacteria group bacterium]
MAKTQDLQNIKQQILDNNVCSDLASQATQLVFGSGNPDANIVFVGEAPGKNEDLVGEPFVGKAGHLLDDMLQSVHIDRNQI